MIGFQTIGNATLIAIDGEPVLVTDPWIRGEPYFGSWTWPYEIPKEQRELICRCPFVWFSHGHPDHLNASSLDALSGKQILLADHVGRRVHHDLTSLGFNARILPERSWLKVSENIQIMTVSDYNQDSILLLDINGRLVVNLNDATDHGWGRLVRKIAKGYEDTYLLKLSGYGDADMMNLFMKDGRCIIPYAAQKRPIGQHLQRAASRYRARYVIPFSSFHWMQREDSVWANEYHAPLEAYPEGFTSKEAELLPAFVSVDCRTGVVTKLSPPKSESVVKPASAFGDDWSEPLDKEDQSKLNAYIKAKERLKDHFDFITFRVGGKDATVDLNPSRHKTGIRFEVPRNSLMTAVNYQVFDDLLIGNFMKTTLIGCKSLYPHFTPVVAKHADNGKAQSRSEVRRYFWEYFKRAPLEFMSHMLEENSVNMFRTYLPAESKAFQFAKRVYGIVQARSLHS